MDTAHPLYPVPVLARGRGARSTGYGIQHESSVRADGIEEEMGEAARPSGKAADAGRGLDELLQLFHRARHIQEDQAELGLLASHDGQHGFFADGAEDDVAVLPLDVDLLQMAAP